MMSFPGHFSSIVSFAAQSRSRGRFLDCRVVCRDGCMRVHRLVLASASPFLASLLRETQDEPECVLLMPETSVALLNTLVHFVYSGEMRAELEWCEALTRLVEQLQIDPQNVIVVNDKTRSSKENLGSNEDDDGDGGGGDKRNGDMDSNSKQQGGEGQSRASRRAARSNSNSDLSSPGPRAKRRFSQESQQTSAAKAQRLSDRGNSAPVMIKVTRPPANSKETFNPARTAKASLLSTTPSACDRRGQSRRRGQSMHITIQEPKVPSLGAGDLAKQNENDKPLAGFHDWSDVHTWVCAICKCYDPPPPTTLSATSPIDTTTAWVGCDCNRWFHVLCTNMDDVEKDFSCAKLNFDCLKN